MSGSALRVRRAGSGGVMARQILLYAVLAAVALVYIYPFLVQVATSFKPDAEAASSPV